MKINWLVRAKNPAFWIHVALAVAAPVLAYFGLTGADMTTWGKVLETVKAAVANPYVVVMVLVSVANAIHDPTTTGVYDSKQVLSISEPEPNCADKSCQRNG